MKVFYSVNSGIWFENRGQTFVIDGFHEGKNVGMSDMPESLRHSVAEGFGLFGQPFYIGFTHLHEDHFSGEIVRKIIRTNENARPLNFRLNGGDVVLEKEGIYEFADRAVRFVIFPTRHDGASYSDFPHCSMIIETEGIKIMLAGDAVLDESVAQAMRDMSMNNVDILFLNPLQLTEDCTMNFIGLCRAEQVIVTHLPLEEDDVFSYGKTAKWAVEKCKSAIPNLRIARHMEYLN